jgi:tripartite-type tricarboxylate transporter receptor subunit TctC
MKSNSITRRKALTFATLSALTTTTSMGSSAVLAQTPAAGITRIVVPYPPGGPLDLAARAIAEAAAPALGTVVVENRSGAGGNVGADAVAKAAPDGRTLLVGAVATHAINPVLFPRMPYDAVRDFSPLTLIADVPNVLIVNDAFAKHHQIERVADLVAWMQRNPGRAQFASGGNGSAGHLAGELFKMRTKTFALHIPYRGAPPAQMALLSGEVQFMFDNLASAAPRIREGKVKALGVTTLAASSSMPQLQPLDQSGVSALKGFDISTWFALFAPAGVPKATLDNLQSVLTRAITAPSVVAVLDRMAAAPQTSTPDQLAQKIAADTSKYRDIIKYSGAKVD